MKYDEDKPELIDLKDWEQSGEGWNALSYFHKTDGGLVLKMNSDSLSYEDTLTEFKLSKAVHDLGVKCPAALNLVTDGKRFGFISERLVGKKSFARTLSEHPEMIDSLAKDMADEAKKLHSIQCDSALFESVPERLRAEINSCRWIKDNLKKTLDSYADGMRPVTTCLHGDMHPGNILRTDKGDYWIDFGRFGHGDPDMDYASQFILANLTPAYMTEWILHIDHTIYSRFVELYGQYYYGDSFYAPETQERLRRAICLALGHGMTKSPAASRIFGHYVRGHAKLTKFLVRVVSLLIKSKESA